MTLQQLVVQIQGLSANDSDLNGLNDMLKSSATEALLKQHNTAILDALRSLNFESHSLGCLYLLEAKGKHSNSNAGDAAFFRAAGDFLCACTPAQVRRAPKPFASLCSSFKSHALNLGQAKRAILPLIAAVRAICPEPGAICPAHADLLQCCLLAKCYSAAGDILAEDPISVDPQATAVTATDVLLYCYYGGMLLTGLRQYTRALDLYLAAITAPTKVLNAITVACLKKFILVTLLHSGKRAQLPKYVAPPVLKALKSECSAYQELAQRAEQGPDAVPAAALAEFVASKQDVWRADGNAGLVQKVVDTAAHRKIQSLTQTYATLGMAKVAEATGLQDANAAELEILRMVDCRALQARISHAKGVVEFPSDPDSFSSSGTWDRLNDLMHRCMAVSAKITDADHRVSCDKAYLSKIEVAGTLRTGIAGLPSNEARIAATIADLDDAADEMFPLV